MVWQGRVGDHSPYADFGRGVSDQVAGSMRQRIANRASPGWTPEGGRPHINPSLPGLCKNYFRCRPCTIFRTVAKPRQTGEDDHSKALSGPRAIMQRRR